MKLTVSEAAGLCGISVRTLHYYDEIDLVKPSYISEAGYRFYDEKSLAVLQQALFYREIGFSLEDIRSLLLLGPTERATALKQHRELLVLKRSRLDSLIETVDGIIGGKLMNKHRITQQDVENFEKKYADEVRKRWGSTAQYSQSEKKQTELSEPQKADVMQGAQDIFAAFASHVGEVPDSPQVQQLVKRWQDYISENYYDCPKSMLACLGEMYVSDERFTENLDSYAPGTAALMSEAIRAYCSED